MRITRNKLLEIVHEELQVMLAEAGLYRGDRRTPRTDWIYGADRIANALQGWGHDGDEGSLQTLIWDSMADSMVALRPDKYGIMGTADPANLDALRDAIRTLFKDANDTNPGGEIRDQEVDALANEISRHIRRRQRSRSVDEQDVSVGTGPSQPSKPSKPAHPGSQPKAPTKPAELS